MGTEPSWFQACVPDCPVDQVTWHEALAFANELSKLSKLEACYDLSGDNGVQAGEGLKYESVSFKGLDCPGYRLPTEAEWEYAARAGTTTPFWTGEQLTAEDANCNASYSPADTTVPVRSFDANAWGLYEVHGNVWEWTQDAAQVWRGLVDSDTYDGDAKNPLSTDGSQRVVRGGSWSERGTCRAADRHAGSPETRHKTIGFRLVRTLP